jgi:glycosyltransferase involved in cell wall biosynthesis
VSEKYYLTVCTLGENLQLKECIEALVQLKLNSQHSLEVLVAVNNESTDINFPKEVILVFEPQRGYSNVRNRAISAIPKEANVIFLDDD